MGNIGQVYVMPEAPNMDETSRIVAWLRGMSNDPTSPRIFKFRDRLFYAWWGFRNPSVSMVASRITIAEAIERGDHLKDTTHAG